MKSCNRWDPVFVWNVCKSWLTFISDPHFAMSHFEGANAAGEERLILLMPSVPQFRSIDFYESLHDDSTSPPFNPRVPVGFFFFFYFCPLIEVSTRGIHSQVSRNIYTFVTFWVRTRSSVFQISLWYLVWPINRWLLYSSSHLQPTQLCKPRRVFLTQSWCMETNWKNWVL